jgi:flagellar hook assembly protein FlgD
MSRRFRVNRTLGFLRLSRDRVRVARLEHAPLRVSLVLAHRADLSVKALSSSGRVRRVLFRGQAKRGHHTWRWNGLGTNAKPVGRGRYLIRARATNGLGTVVLGDAVRLVRAG